MKLRIKGNSIRLRLTKSEVHQLEDSGAVEEIVRFGNINWKYSVEVSESPMPTARHLREGGILVEIPENWIRGWGVSDKVGFEAVQSNGTDEGLKLVVEKDFVCLTDRPGEDERDHFPNPLAEQGHH